MQLNDLRRWTHGIAEALDVFRILPRALIIAYCWVMLEVIMWFMGLEAPTTQQSALVTTVVGAGAGFFGLYVNSGKKWSEGFKPWTKDAEDMVKKEEESND